MSRGIFFSGYGSHGNQEDAVFFISMVTIAKGKNSSAYFRMLMWTSIPWEFQTKATIKKMSHPIPLFRVTRAVNATGL